MAKEGCPITLKEENELYAFAGKVFRYLIFRRLDSNIGKARSINLEGKIGSDAIDVFLGEFETQLEKNNSMYRTLSKISPKYRRNAIQLSIMNQIGYKKNYAVELEKIVKNEEYLRVPALPKRNKKVMSEEIQKGIARAYRNTSKTIGRLIEHEPTLTRKEAEEEAKYHYMDLYGETPKYKYAK